MQELVEIAQISDQGQRLDVFWQSILDEEEVPRTQIQQWIKAGHCRINGHICVKASTRIIPGQVLSLFKPKDLALELHADPTPLAIVYADPHVAVINKEAGLTVHPAPSVVESTLVNRALHHFPSLLTQGGSRPGIVHRLDKDTSGLIILALSESAAQTLTEAFSHREVYKEYLALVAGIPPESGRITLDLGRHPSMKTKMAVLKHGGRSAETLYQVLWSAADKSASLLRVCIPTGRTHQIRVHLAAMGHPLLGDRVYADKYTASRAPRQMLHAWRLGFAHPDTGEELHFSCQPPDDFWEVVHQLCQNPVRIGLTGGAGSGKTAVSNALQDLDIPVFCADQAVDQLYAPGQDGAVILEHYFGHKFLDAQGRVDRQALFSALAASDSLRLEVEHLIHPLVLEAMESFFKVQASDILVADIPLLFESNMADLFDLVVVVFCPEDVRKNRLAHRGWSNEHVALVDSWQWPQERKVSRASLVLDNSGSLEELKTKVLAMISLIRSWNQARATQEMDIVLKKIHANSLHKLMPNHVSLAR